MDEARNFKRNKTPWLSDLGTNQESWLTTRLTSWKKIIPPATLKEKERACCAQENCFAMGLTTVDDAGLMKEDVDLIDSSSVVENYRYGFTPCLATAPNYDYYLKTGPYKPKNWISGHLNFMPMVPGLRSNAWRKITATKNWKGFYWMNKNTLNKGGVAGEDAISNGHALYRRFGVQNYSGCL